MIFLRFRIYYLSGKETVAPSAAEPLISVSVTWSVLDIPLGLLDSILETAGIIKPKIPMLIQAIPAILNHDWIKSEAKRS